MSQPTSQTPATEAEAREVGEAARESEWEKPSFAREMFLGSLRMDLIDPFPEEDPKVRAECDAFIERLRRVLIDHIDPEEVDRLGEIPASAIEALRGIGALSIKIPKEYGGLGLSQASYNRAMEMVTAHCASTVILLSAHQSIGVPQPLKLFGTEAQKEKYMRRLATQDLSAFALTEPEAGSDPANMTTTAELDGDEWVLNGEKLWCTNGTIADVIIVMAQTPPKMVNGKPRRQISAFIVETDWPGVEVVHRCRFMGVRGIGNGVLTFKNVRVPKENLLWDEGAGLKLALITLNTGRLTLPSCCVAATKAALGIVRRWAGKRVQWGTHIGGHDEVAGMVSDMATRIYAMQAIADLGCRLVDQAGTDIRLEAAIAKLYNSEVGWDVVNQCFQIRGGRGYETEESLKARGDSPEPVERILRDFRINTVVEGSTQIMHLFIAREALDKHMEVAGALLDPRASFGTKAKAALSAGLFYAGWYPKLWFGWGRWPRFSEYGELATHVRYLERTSRRLARSIFHSMVRYKQQLEKRGRVLGRIVDIGSEMYAMAASISRSRAFAREGKNVHESRQMADQFCRDARRRIDTLFRNLHLNDAETWKLAQSVLEGKHRWLEDGILNPLEDPADAPAPKSGRRDTARPKETTPQA